MEKDQLLFADRRSFRKWLVGNHGGSAGIWLVFGKAGGPKTLTANEALEEALCFGWIDGQIRSLSAEKYLKRFTPRRERSVWSAKNRTLAERLIADGTMAEAGHAAIERAKTHGTWEQTKPEKPGEAQIEVLVKALAGTGTALTNFMKMSPSVQRTYTAAYLDAKKEETRKRRLAWIVGRLKENKKPM